MDLPGPDDRCGSVQQNTAELSGIIEKILRDTGFEQVNIVAHSKGRLDARAYTATGTDNVANLIMIGTPNAGSPAALWDLTGCPPGASAECPYLCILTDMIEFMFYL
jgi:triacylglycerol lipase